MCCVSAIMTNTRDGTQDQLYRCMNYKLASVNFEMKLNDVNINMKCIDSQSGAKYMTSAIMATVVSLIAMSMW